MATYLDLLPLELTEIIYEKKHQLEMNELSKDIHLCFHDSFEKYNLPVQMMLEFIKDKKEEEEEEEEEVSDDGDLDFALSPDTKKRFEVLMSATEFEGETWYDCM